MPHPPQLAAVVYETQPPAHAEKPPLHAYPQPPSPQVGWAFVTGVVQRVPHPPQLAGSEFVATQPPSQALGAVSGHVGTHTYALEPGTGWQVAGLPSTAQTLPQPPQLDGSDG